MMNGNYRGKKFVNIRTSSSTKCPLYECCPLLHDAHRPSLCRDVDTLR